MIKDPKNTEQRLFYHLLSSVVTPRPIALVSSLDKRGNQNLAPFSFFNMVSVNPPILVFSPLNRMRDSTTKDTLNNAKVNAEVVINILGYEHVGQMSLTGGEYDSSINEFDKSGFNAEKSVKVAPPRVKEALASFECKVTEIIALGSDGGAGNLVVCEVLLAHFCDDIIDADGNVMTDSFIPVGRLGKSYYIKGDSNSVFEVEKEATAAGIGWDQVPDFIKQSSLLTGNEISALASVKELPEIAKEVSPLTNDERISLVKGMLSENKIKQAWEVLLG